MSLVKLVSLVLFVSVLCGLECSCDISASTREMTQIKENTAVQARKKGNSDLMTRILPMLAMPFIMQATLLPMTLISMKFMLLKSMFLGKMAILFGFVTLLRNLLKNQGGLYSHTVHVRQPQVFGHPTKHRVHKRKKRKVEL